MKKIVCVIALMLVSTIIFVAYFHNNNKVSISDKIIRFHVIANSDSEEDQNVKLMIRDELLEEHGDKLSKLNSRNESIEYLSDNLKEIESRANAILKRENKNYSARAVIGESQFPIKQYGDLTLPAGEYTALKVVLGEGGGKNWWCVMFPPLCFIDITHGRATKESSEVLNRVIRSDEKQSISVFKQPTAKAGVATVKTNQEKAKETPGTEKKKPAVKNKKLVPNVQFKFKSLEVLKKTLDKLANIF